MQNWFCYFLLSASLLFGEGYSVKERLTQAKSGDYIVTEANKMITLLTIRVNSPTVLILEEISAPTHHLKKMPASWADWIKAKAPGHTSWSMIEINPQTGQVVECYSFSRSSWVQTSANESLIATLLKLPLKTVPREERRKIGLPPQPGEADHRKIWEPPVIFEGRQKENASSEAYEAIWPEDGSELSKQKVCLYFDKEQSFPFPFWIQVETTHATGALRTIDAGKNLPSFYRTLPRRVPEFIGLPQKTDKGLRFSLKSPKYFRQFELFAIDVTTKEKHIFPISHSLVLGEEERLTLEVEKEELQQILQPEHRYTWLLVPLGHSESYTEMRKPFTWIP